MGCICWNIYPVFLSNSPFHHQSKVIKRRLFMHRHAPNALEVFPAFNPSVLQWQSSSHVMLFTTEAPFRLCSTHSVLCFSLPDSPVLTSRVAVTVHVLDINEFPPELASPYETFVCENAKAGQVCSRILINTARVDNCWLECCLLSPIKLIRLKGCWKQKGPQIESERCGVRYMLAKSHYLLFVCADYNFVFVFFSPHCCSKYTHLHWNLTEGWFPAFYSRSLEQNLSFQGIWQENPSAGGMNLNLELIVSYRWIQQEKQS